MAFDFIKLNPEESAKIRKEISDRIKAKEKAQVFMINYLRNKEDEMNEWEQSFIRSISNKVGVFTLTEKQDECLTKIFEKY